MDDELRRRPMVRKEADGSTVDRAAAPRSKEAASRWAGNRFVVDLMHQGFTEGIIGRKAAAKLEGAIGSGFRGDLSFLIIRLRSHCAYRLLAPYGNCVKETRPAPAEAASRVEARHVAMRLRPGGCLGGVHQRRRRGDAMTKEVPRPRRGGATAGDAGRALALTSASREDCACNPAATTDAVSASVRRARQGLTHVSAERPLVDSPLVRMVTPAAVDPPCLCALWKRMTPLLDGGRRRRRATIPRPPIAGTARSGRARI